MTMRHATITRLTDIDLADPDTFTAGFPHEAFALLRAQAPVHWHPERAGGGFWVVFALVLIEAR